MADELGISRTPMQAAAWQLSVEGLVAIRPRVGVYVREIPPREILEVHRIKRALEPLIAAWAASRATPTEHNLLRDNLECLRVAAERENVVEYVTLLEQRIIHLTTAAHTSVMAIVFAVLDGRIRLVRYQNLSQPRSLPRSLKQHERIAVAIEKRDPQAAFLAMEMHLKDAERRVMRLVGVQPHAYPEMIFDLPRKSIANEGRT